MSDVSRKNAETTRGRPFEPGNSGRPKGSRNKVTLAMEALLQGEGEALTRKAVEMALAGDTVALRLCMDRLYPAPKDRAVSFELPPMENPDDLVKAGAAISEAVASGVITPMEAKAVADVIETQRRALETLDIEQRLAALEAQR